MPTKRKGVLKNRLHTPLETIVRLSRLYGGPEFVLAGGGNTSVKVGRRLFIKASGYALADIDAQGFVEMDRDALDLLSRARPDKDPARREDRFKRALLAARSDPSRGLRPSVECVMHHVMPGRFVIHTHPSLVNALTCCRRAERIIRRLFGDDVVWVPYVDPGCRLGQAVAAALAHHRKRTGREAPEAVLMQNHGLIVSGDDPQTVRRRTVRVVRVVRGLIAKAPGAGRPAFGKVARLAPDRAARLVEVIAPALRGLLGDGPALKIVTFDDSDAVLSLVGTAEGKAVAALEPMGPDQIVYCGSLPLWFDPGERRTADELVPALRRSLGDYVRKAGAPPRIMLVKGLGMFAAGDDFKAADTARGFYKAVIGLMAGAKRLGGVRPMGARDRRFIEAWEAEAHRKKVSLGSGPSGRVGGKVAVVTGAAQGFGLEIARDLADRGAHVALADVNGEGARKAADEINARLGRGRATGLALNVTDNASVDEAVLRVVRTYGGLDVLVSNAGILRAGSVKAQPRRDFDLVTAVNYTGYFVCAQEAAPIMAVQHLARPDAWFDIIQVNSKSGLAGSNRNAAYAGSKFGGIGLTQSFALELVEDGIKVNAICPGNFFDGPLWSDPRTGLFVQYLHEGKVPGARTIADVRRAYEAKVPMGRGCAADDVMKAIYYVIEQTYETGQAVPVTGGQVMLS